MLTIMSPTKTFKEGCKSVVFDTKSLTFQKETDSLIKHMQQYNEEEIVKLMKVSMPLATSTTKRYKSFYEKDAVAYPALYYYGGEAFKALEADTLTEEAVSFANRHLRILSGLYGVVEPLQGIRPYRLEMGCKFGKGEIVDLYTFWNTKLTHKVIEALSVSEGDKVLINLASEEYSKSLDLAKIGESYKVVTIVFKEKKGEVYKVVGMYAKKARGRMIRYILENKLTRVETIKAFQEDGYVFNTELSEENIWIYTR